MYAANICVIPTKRSHPIRNISLNIYRRLNKRANCWLRSLNCSLISLMFRRKKNVCDVKVHRDRRKFEVYHLKSLQYCHWISHLSQQNFFSLNVYFHGSIVRFFPQICHSKTWTEWDLDICKAIFIRAKKK